MRLQNLFLLCHFIFSIQSKVHEVQATDQLFPCKPCSDKGLLIFFFFFNVFFDVADELPSPQLAFPVPDRNVGCMRCSNRHDLFITLHSHHLKFKKFILIF